MKLNRAFDTSKELLVQRYKQGIRLVRPNASAEYVSRQSVASIFDLPTQIYFKDHETRLADLNSATLKITGAQSKADAIGKYPDPFIRKSFRDRILQQDLAVITSEKMIVLEESGERSDGLQIKTLSFKFPWYQNEKIIGLFGCSINVDQDNIGNFANAMTRLIATGLIGHAPTSANTFLPQLKDGDICFSQREREVLGLLVRGKTAKEIGILLQISKRTAEKHMINIKTKSNCASKSELIDKFVDQFI